MLAPDTRLTDLSWVPRPRHAPLARLGLVTLADLIGHYPRRHEDRRRFDRFPDDEMERAVCLFGIVTKTAVKRFGGRRQMFEATLEDESAGVLGQPVSCRWFNMPYIPKMISNGLRMVVFGRPKKKGRQIVMDHPEFETIEEDEEISLHMNRIVPVHPAGDGISPRVLRTLIHRALAETDLGVMAGLLGGDHAAALRTIHFPEDFPAWENARGRLVREEFYAIQILIHGRRAEWSRLEGHEKKPQGKLLDRLLNVLPFPLTPSQERVIQEIRADLASSHRMNRLLQGDVGSGKTLVALAAMLLAVESGWKAAIMAPTQILAEQHYLNFRRLLDPLGIPVALHTGARKENSVVPHAAGVCVPAARRDDASGGPEPLQVHYSKRSLPHFERPWAKYMITFGSREKNVLSASARKTVLACILHNRTRYHLYAACVMPDHAHLLIEPAVKEHDESGKTVFYSLKEILHTIKSFTAHQINEAENASGSVWEKESFDRMIRSEADLHEKFSYITRNPWDAGIVSPNEDYPYVWWPEKQSEGSIMARQELAAFQADSSGGPPEDAPGPGALPKAPQILVGTHALLYEGAECGRLGLVVIDEQHKFGVLQRARLIERGDAPDVLVMTATPIPRTITQTLYGDLDISLLLEKPASRGEIQTAVRGAGKLPEVVDFLRKQLEKGRQAYVVYPLVEESDKLAAKSALAEFEKWKPLVAPFEAGLIHGRLPAEEKEAVMTRFRKGEIAVLVATTVIEVGVDVPNANIMVVENAERFGLAQLHQLRGRIGRGAHKSYCILLHDPKAGEPALAKLAVLEKTSDGFVVAEADWHQRGAGDLLGTAQTGLPPLKLGDLQRDGDIMREMAVRASELFAADPLVSNPGNANLSHFLAASRARVAAG